MLGGRVPGLRSSGLVVRAKRSQPLMAASLLRRALQAARGSTTCAVHKLTSQHSPMHHRSLARLGVLSGHLSNPGQQRLSHVALAAGENVSAATQVPASASTATMNGNGSGESASGYRFPPPEIRNIVDAPAQPSLSYSPDRTMLLQLGRPPSLPPIYELSRPELKLAGLRIDPELYARSKMGHYTDLSLVPAGEMLPAPPEKCRRVSGYPEGSWINYAAWSPDGKHVSFTVRSPGGPSDPPRQPLELWVADVATATARRLLAAGPGTGAPGSVQGLNAVFEDYSWLDDNTIVAAVIPSGHPAPPTKPPMPPGPKVQDNTSGRKAQSRTFPDLLKDDHDVALFDHYGMSEIVKIDVRTGTVTRIGSPRMYTEVDPSPDGRYLIVSWLQRPYSFALPCGRFPRVTQLWDAATGTPLRTLADLPLAEDIPIAFNSTRVGPRGISWRDDQPAELWWIEARDGGDPAVQVSPRDVVYTLRADDIVAAAAAASSSGSNGTGADAASAVPPRQIAQTDLRCGGVAWCDGDFAMVFESWWKTRRSVCWRFAPDRPEEGMKVLFDRNYEDVYTDPGSPLTRRTQWGTYVLARVHPHLPAPSSSLASSSSSSSLSDSSKDQHHQQQQPPPYLLMAGGGASPEGNKPFLDLWDYESGTTVRLWQSAAPYYEQMGSLMSDVDPDAPITLDGLKLLKARESVTDPPQSYITTCKYDLSAPPPPASSSENTTNETTTDTTGSETTSVSTSTKPLVDVGCLSFTEQQITNWPHPYPELRNLQREVLRYTRAPYDSVMLTATLYTPPGYDPKKDGPLPCLFWAYPREYKSKEAAGQMRRSPYQFSSIGDLSPTLWLARGYAVLDGPTLPIVAEGDEEPNDTYVEQLVASAQAAIDEVVKRGIVDPSKIVCGGHSYGAFMAANLVAHAPHLFAAGVARTGAYNRTLTPFGFQSEERTLWQAPDIYAKMSPFMMADKIKKPLLLIHGEDDNNPGTFPLQSERFYQALKGHGAVTRLVLLPHESHGYRAYESVMHTLYEQDQWFERYGGYSRTDPTYYTGESDSNGSSSE